MTDTYSRSYRDYVAKLLINLTSASRAAVEADQRVKHHIQRLDEYTTSRDYTDHSARQKKLNDPQLTDALDSYRKQCSEVARVSATLVGVIAAIEFLDRVDV